MITDEMMEDGQKHGASSSMVINDEIIQDSKIHQSNLSKDLKLSVDLGLNKLGLSGQESSEIYGYDADALSPITHHDYKSERPSFSMAIGLTRGKSSGMSQSGWSRQSSVN